MRSKKPVHVADLIARFLAQRHGHPSRGSEATTMKVFAAFAAIGPPLTEHCEPAFFKGGVLGLTVGDSAWLTELVFLRPQILDRLNRAIGKTVVKEIRMKQGRLSVRKPKPVKEPPKISHAQAEQIEEWAAPIANSELREAMMKAAARSIERASTTRAPRLYEGPPGPSPTKHEEHKPEVAEEIDRWPKDRDRWKRKREK